MRNWKTSLCGALFAAGHVLLNTTGNTGVWWVGLALVTLGGGGIGAFAKDRDVAGVPKP